MHQLLVKILIKEITHVMESLFTFDMPVLEFVNICDVMRNLVPFVQFKKREKLPWRSVTFSKIATLLK